MKPIFIHDSSEDESITVNEVFDNLVYQPDWFDFSPDKIKNVVDVGAYIGAFSLWIHEKFPNSTIHSFEPDPLSYDYLVKNIKASKAENQIHAFNYAIWPTKQNVKLHRFENTFGSNSLLFEKRPFTKKLQDSIDVKTKNIKEILDEIHSIDFLKLDCEGSEYAILYSLDIEELKKIQYMVIEYHEFDDDLSHKGKKLAEFLTNHGFTTQVIPTDIRKDQGLGYIYASKVESDKRYQKIFDQLTIRLENLLKISDERDQYAKNLEQTVTEKDQYAKNLEQTVTEKDQYAKNLEQTVTEKDQYAKNLEQTVTEKDQYAKNLEQTVTEKDQYAKNLEQTVTEKDQYAKNLEQTVTEKDQYAKNLEQTVTEKDQYAKNLEQTVTEKDQYAKNLEQTVTEKDQYAKNLEQTVTEKDQYAKNLEQTVTEKDQYAKNLEQTVTEKDQDLNNKINSLESHASKIVQLENEYKENQNHIVELRCELDDINRSDIFRVSSSFTKKIDNIFPNGTRRGELKKIVANSANIISSNGWSKYFSDVNTKLKRKEYQVYSPTSLSATDEDSLKEKVRKNRQNRITIQNTDDSLLDSDKIPVQTKEYDDTQSLQIDLSQDPVVACTIVSKNYLSQARVLTKSFLEKNPLGKIFVLLADSNQNEIDLSNENFTLVKLQDIGIPSLDSFCFKYSIVELNTGVKAHFLEYLFKKLDLKKLIYFDPDILITNKLDNLWSLLNEKSIVITPHITAPITDNKNPSEQDLMKAGNFNLGFIGLRWDSNTKAFLNWWQQKLYDFCIMDPEKGLHVDQKWVELAPSLFDNSYILRHPGYNIAYWNLMSRTIETKNDNYLSNGKPVYFFHFSGFMPENIEKISKHQDRFKLKNFPNLKPLFEYYRDLLIESGYLETKKLHYAFDYFNNGVRIPLEARIIYRETLDKEKFGNPFDTKGSESFFSFLTGTVDNNHPSIARLWYQVYKERSDLHQAFPEPLGKDRSAFFNWCVSTLQREYGWSDLLLPMESPIQSNTTKLDSKSISQKSNLTGPKTGINIAGYFEGQFGIGSSVRYYTEAIKKSKIPFTLNNFASAHHNANDKTFSDFSDENQYPINLVVVNADQIDVFRDSVGFDYFTNKYNIAIWAWEPNSFPDKLINNTKYFDEIWAISSFVANSISKKSPIPVIRMNTPLVLDESKLISNKEKFQIKNDQFLFLFVFDFLSVFERKNPLGVIKAFKQAFQNNENVSLVIKCINHNEFHSDFKKLQNEANQNIHLLTENLSKDDLLSLIASCDCYVSLHRSEGFGLTIAEAMYAGKPVIATNYGGNTDFMNANNSYPINYTLVELDKNYGSYEKGNVWAEPDIDNASELMKNVFENNEKSKLIGKTAQSEIRQILSPKTIGEQISNRLDYVLNQKKSLLHS